MCMGLSYSLPFANAAIILEALKNPNPFFIASPILLCF